MSGAVRNGIDHTLPGVVGRGVLLDIARLRGVEWILADDDPITSADLDAAAERQAVEVRTGDALLVRTGFEALAEDCAADGQWDFFFSAPPLRVTGAVGSTASPIAVK